MPLNSTYPPEGGIRECRFFKNIIDLSNNKMYSRDIKRPNMSKGYRLDRISDELFWR